MSYEIAKVHVSGVEATTVEADAIPAGIIGATIAVAYGPEWDNLIKNVTFKGANNVTKKKVGNVVELPREVAATPGAYVQIGFTGLAADGSTLIHTIWAELGTVQDSACDDFGPPSENELPLWAQLQADVDNLEKEVDELKNGSPGGGLFVTDDGEGNVTVTASGSAQITDDGSGNVVIS